MFLVTALVSTYNAQNWLPGRLDNLLSQTLGDQLEIVVIDSGSQQDEAGVVAEYQRRHPNIVYRRTPHQSLYASWNHGIGLASGRYLTSANTDDRLCLHALERLVETLEQNARCALVYADNWETHSQAVVLAWSGAPECGEPRVRRAAYSHRRLLLNCMVGPQPLWRRSVHGQLGLFDESYRVAGDWEFWLRLAEHSPMLHIDEPLGLYYRNPHGLEHSQGELLQRENRRILRHYLGLPGSKP